MTQSNYIYPTFSGFMEAQSDLWGYPTILRPCNYILFLLPGV